jgi:hypothetical protein
MESKIASKLQEGASQGEREKRPGVSDLTSIPTEDPRAALQFCQSLARMLADASNPQSTIPVSTKPSAGSKLRHLLQNINRSCLSLFQSLMRKRTLLFCTLG